MSNFLRKAFLFCSTVLLSHSAFAEEYSQLKRILNSINISVAVGGRQDDYVQTIALIDQKASNEEKKRAILQQNDDTKQFFIATQDKQYPVVWPFNKYEQQNATGLLNKGFVKAEFEGIQTSIPVTIGAHIDPWKKFRIGLGADLVFHTLDKLTVQSPGSLLTTYESTNSKYYSISPFVKFGYKFLEKDKLSALFDYSLGSNWMYDTNRKYQSADNQFAYSIGLTIERDISEYVKGFGRLSLNGLGDIRELDKKVVVSKEVGGIGLQFGVSLKYPETPRCSLPGCKIKGKHRHGGKTYRGTAFWSSVD